MLDIIRQVELYHTRSYTLEAPTRLSWHIWLMCYDMGVVL